MAKHHGHHSHKHGHNKGDGHRDHEMHMHVHHHKKKGGRVGLVASGNPDVLKEAHEDEDGAETGYKRGGKAKKKHHGKHHEKMRMDGGGVRARLDRPGRKAGGAVGANRSPLSTAHGGGHGATGSSNPADTYGGTPD